LREELLDARKISPEEFKLYKLFSSELGSECLRTMMNEMFWEEPGETLMTEGVLAFYDGRRSVLRGIKSTIEKVQSIITQQLTIEANNDGSNNYPQ
jgi:hypothetical protein